MSNTAKSPWSDLANEILDILKQSAEDFLDEQGVEQFLKETAERYAKWKYKAITTTNPKKRKEYEGNLKDVLAQVDIEVARLAVASSKATLKLLATIAKTVGKFLLKLAPSLLGIPIPGF